MRELFDAIRALFVQPKPETAPAAPARKPRELVPPIPFEKADGTVLAGEITRRRTDTRTR